MQYGKFISEGEIEFAPRNYENIINFNLDESLMVEHGFKPVTDTLRPEIDESYQEAHWKWVDSEDKIVKEWTVIEYKSEEEREREEQERIAMLKLTRGDVFRGLLQARGITRTQLRAVIENLPEETQEQALKKELALIDFDEALDFYRGNALINTVGAQLGITEGQLTSFFETGDFRFLVATTTEVEE